MSLTPPPAPSQNSHAIRWHCTAESERRVAVWTLTAMTECLPAPGPAVSRTSAFAAAEMDMGRSFHGLDWVGLGWVELGRVWSEISVV